MPRRPTVPDELTHRPFTVREALAAGVTRDQLRGAAYRRLSRGVYVTARETDASARLAAIAMQLPPGSAFSGPTAATIHGINLRIEAPVEVHAPAGVSVRPRAYLRVRRGRLDAHDVTAVRGLPVTIPARTAFDLARRLPILDAVAAVDAMLHRRLLSAKDLAKYVALHPRMEGAAEARRVLELADPRAESPMESVLRATLAVAGLPRPECQVRLCDPAGHFIGRVDLYYREARLVIEYDGQGHRDSLVVDLRRQNELLAAGYHLLRFSYPDVIGRPRALVSKVAEALRNGAIPAGG